MSCSRWRQSFSISALRGPASSSSTSSPRAASSFAATGPPPPAPITITSRMPCSFPLANRPLRSADRPAAAVVALELVPAIDGGMASRKVPGEFPSHRSLCRHQTLTVEDAELGERREGGELQQRACQELHESRQRLLTRLGRGGVEQLDQLGVVALKPAEDLRLLSRAEIREGRGREGSEDRQRIDRRGDE